jgi:hypothetical protein
LWLKAGGDVRAAGEGCGEEFFSGLANGGDPLPQQGVVRNACVMAGYCECDIWRPHFEPRKGGSVDRVRGSLHLAPQEPLESGRVFADVVQ